ncbi:hypothetical protein, partial [Gluconobacter kanchanaburiensis]|uniref:hypothetical protein n=1 Tax=Gluconobacter kanchanaburiensis TaxID=563199 RepID=UPI0022328ED8
RLRGSTGEVLPLASCFVGSHGTLLAQLKRTSENRIAIQKSDFRKRQKKNQNTSRFIISSHRLTENAP